MGKIFYVMGKSSSGKDTIFANILGRKELHLNQIILYTTRPARANETDGVQYHFVNEEKLNELERAGKVIELRKDYSFKTMLLGCFAGAGTDFAIGVVYFYVIMSRQHHIA